MAMEREALVPDLIAMADDNDEAYFGSLSARERDLFVAQLKELLELSRRLQPGKMRGERLEYKGRVYELIHTVNSMRRDQGFELTDRIRLTVPSADADLVERHGDWIKQETLAVDLDTDGAGQIAIARVES